MPSLQLKNKTSPEIIKMGYVIPEKTHFKIVMVNIFKYPRAPCKRSLLKI